MKKVIPVLIILTLLLGACDLLPPGLVEKPLSDAEMATKVAQLLGTMTTPTTEMVFPPTSTVTAAAPTAEPPTATVELPTATQPPAETTVAPTVEGATPEPTTEAPTETPEATATTVPGDPASLLGEPTGVDALDSYEKWLWPTDPDDYLRVAFKDGHFNMTGLTKYVGWRLPTIDQQINTYIEVTVNSGTCKEKDSYGIIFRVPILAKPTQGYLFEVTCDGYYRLWEWNGKAKPKGVAENLLNWKKSADVKTGADQVNKLGVLVNGKNMKLYINGVLQGEANDSTYEAGFFGVFVRAAGTEKYTVKYDEIRYWENPQ